MSVYMIIEIMAELKQWLGAFLEDLQSDSSRVSPKRGNNESDLRLTIYRVL